MRFPFRSLHRVLPAALRLLPILVLFGVVAVWFHFVDHEAGLTAPYVWALLCLAAAAAVAVTLAAARVEAELRAQAAELARSKAHFQAAFGHAPNALLVTDVVTGRVLDANESFLRLTGAPREAVLGKTTTELGLWNDPVARERFVTALRRDRRVQAMPHRTVDTAGHVWDMLVYAELIEVEREVRLLTTLIDVSEQARAHEHEREQAEWLRFVLESAGAGTYEFDLKTNALKRSAVYDQIWGLAAPDEWTTNHVFEAIHPDDRPRVLAAHQSAGATTFAYEFRATRPDGKLMWLRTRGRTLGDERGVASRILGVTFDVTAEKEHQQTEQRLREQLLQAQKMEAIGTLAGGVAHDFNNLMAAVLAGLAVLESAPADSELTRQILGEVKGAVKRGSELTRQLLGFARRGRYNARPLDLNELVATTARLFGRTRPNVSLVVDTPAEAVTIVGDEAQVEQVVLNLLINAGQAMPTGGRLTVCLAQEAIDAAAAAGLGLAPGLHAKISVTDTGAGMDEATRARAFEPFFTTRTSGSGLGLASVFGVVKNHGGAVSVESALGQGARFTVYLPLTDRPAEARTAHAEAPVRGTETLLLIDDDDAVRSAIAAALRGCGYQVLTAASRESGLETFRLNRDRVAVAVVDVVMPGMTAAEMVDALYTIDPGARVLLVSGHGGQDEVARILERKGTAFLAKPFEIAAATRAVRSLIDR
jgi:PAS domain S-box-containing protein